MDLCFSGMSSVQIYSLLTQASGGSSSRAEDENLKYQTISTIYFFISIRTELLGVFYLYLRYRCLTIMGNLAGSEERTVDLLHN